jgi:hypothetical protein
MLNAFTAFDCIPKDLLQTKLNRVNTEIDRLKKLEKTNHYYDDYCLSQFLRGVLARELYEETDSKESMLELNKQSLTELFNNADKVELDHYIYYFGRYENARMLIVQDEYQKAEAEIQVVLKANDRGHYNVGTGPHAKNKYSLASALVFKCHNCMAKIKDESK